MTMSSIALSTWTGRLIDPAAQRIHDITKEMLAGQPKAEEVMPGFSSFIQDSIMVAHYAEFDLNVVGSEFRRLYNDLEDAKITAMIWIHLDQKKKYFAVMLTTLLAAFRSRSSPG